MSHKKIREQVVVEIARWSGRSQPERGFFREGVVEPKKLSELAIWVEESRSFDLELGEFGDQDGWQVHIGGSRRALCELGVFLIGLSKFEPLDEGYHSHLEDLLKIDGALPCSLIAHRALDPDELRRTQAGGADPPAGAHEKPLEAGPARGTRTAATARGHGGVP